MTSRATPRRHAVLVDGVHAGQRLGLERATRGPGPARRRPWPCWAGDEVHPISPPALVALKPIRVSTLVRWAGRQQVQDRLPAPLRQFGDRVRGVVGAHPGQHARRSPVGPRAEQPGGQVLVEFLEDVRLEFGVGVDPAEDLGLLFLGGVLQQVGDLGRLQPADAGERAAQQRAARVPDEPLEVVPVAEQPPGRPDVSGPSSPNSRRGGAGCPPRTPPIPRRPGPVPGRPRGPGGRSARR